MARIRTIKPDFWTDEKVVNMTAFARLLFIGLWNLADDEGRMLYSPTRIKLQVFPADDLSISELFGEIRREKLITIYVVDGVEYLQVNNFARHQKIDKRTASKLPAPPPNSGSPAESPRIPTTEVEVEVEVEVEREGEKNKVKPIVGQKTPDTPPKGDAEKDGKTAALLAEAEDVLAYLNRQAGKAFKFRNPDGSLTASADRIVSRLKAGYTALQLREVVFAKVEQWGNDPKMVEYLRPATLFAKENFEQYLGDLTPVGEVANG